MVGCRWNIGIIFPFSTFTGSRALKTSPISLFISGSKIDRFFNECVCVSCYHRYRRTHINIRYSKNRNRIMQYYVNIFEFIHIMVFIICLINPSHVSSAASRTNSESESSYICDVSTVYYLYAFVACVFIVSVLRYNVSHTQTLTRTQVQAQLMGWLCIYL